MKFGCGMRLLPIGEFILKFSVKVLRADFYFSLQGDEEIYRDGVAAVSLVTSDDFVSLHDTPYT